MNDGPTDGYVPRRLVVVRWIDSFRNCGWDSLDEKLQDDHKAGACRSVGWVVEDSEEWLGLTMSWSGDKHVGCLVRIPKVAVKDIRPVEGG